MYLLQSFSVVWVVYFYFKRLKIKFLMTIAHDFRPFLYLPMTCRIRPYVLFLFQFNFYGCFVIFCQVFCVLLYICFYLILIFAFFLNMTIALFKKTWLWFKVAPNCLPNRTPSVSRILHPQFSYLYLQLSSPCVQCIYFI